MKTRDTQNIILFVFLLLLSFTVGFELNETLKESNKHYIIHDISNSMAHSHPYSHPLPVMHKPRGHYHPHGNFNFRKIGFLTSREMADSIIMPLFGEPAPYRRYRYNYYTVNDTHNSLTSVKLPLYHKDLDCTAEVACDEIYSGDLVRVHGYNAPFVAEVY